MHTFTKNQNIDKNLRSKKHMLIYYKFNYTMLYTIKIKNIIFYIYMNFVIVFIVCMMYTE